MMENSIQHKYECDLQKVIPGQNMFRFYRVFISEDLLGGFSIIHEWGRIGSSGTIRVKNFETLNEAQRYFYDIILKKEKRGYVEVTLH